MEYKQKKDLTVLSELKEFRYDQIDDKTDELITTGFIYDNETFSTSHHAQMNWNSLRNQTGEYTWPLNISTKDNNTYSLLQANVPAFWTELIDALADHVDSGRVLKKSIFIAADIAAVDAVVDNR